MNEMKNSGTGKSLRLVLIISIFLILGIFVAIVLYYNYYIVDYYEIPASVSVIPSGAAFNISNDSLSFGKNYPGGGGSRSFNLLSEKDVHVKIASAGSISQFISFSQSNFILKANSSHAVDVNLDIPEQADLGYYNGKIRVYFLRW